MILPSVPPTDKTDPFSALPPDLHDYARRAAESKVSLDTFERGLFKKLLAMGHTVTNLFLSMNDRLGVKGLDRIGDSSGRLVGV